MNGTGSDPDPTSLYTVGHGTLAQGELAGLLRAARVTQVVDVRSYPGSRRNPQYGRAELEQWLPAAGIGYAWDRRLGGRRRPDARSPHVALRNEAFRGYADHMETPDFRAALADLIRQATTGPTAVMCSESVWWRCHRRLLADAVEVLWGVPVLHLFHDGRLVRHQPSPEARAAGDHLVYDVGSSEPLL